jgi:hypothetical protein
MDDLINHVPGEPGVKLSNAGVREFLISELATPVLDQLYDHLWCVARKSGKSIDSISTQRVKSRVIVATEDASLHLVWHRDIIYVKPMPLCLLNYDFWTTYLPSAVPHTTSNESVSSSPQHTQAPIFDRKIALGFVRSYALLIRHRIDFVLAREAYLFPAEFSWAEFSEFIACFRFVEDGDVAMRYHYGQLRLSRLNWAVRLFRPLAASTKWFYVIPHWSTGIYVQRAIAPVVFVFASLSLVLSSMQVMLTVPDDKLGFSHIDTSSLSAMRRAFWVFPIMVLLMSGLVWTLLFAIPAGVLIWQIRWGFQNKDRIDKKGSKEDKQTDVVKV